MQHNMPILYKINLRLITGYGRGASISTENWPGKKWGMDIGKATADLMIIKNDLLLCANKNIKIGNFDCWISPC